MWRDVRRGGRRCAGIVNVMLMVLMGSRCHTSGMRIQSHAGVTLLPVYMPRVRTLGPDHLRSDLREPNEHNLLLFRHFAWRAGLRPTARVTVASFSFPRLYPFFYIPHFLISSLFFFSSLLIIPLQRDRRCWWLIRILAISLNRPLSDFVVYLSLHL